MGLDVGNATIFFCGGNICRCNKRFNFCDSIAPPMQSIRKEIGNKSKFRRQFYYGMLTEHFPAGQLYNGQGYCRAGKHDRCARFCAKVTGVRTRTFVNSIIPIVLLTFSNNKKREPGIFVISKQLSQRPSQHTRHRRHDTCQSCRIAGTRNFDRSRGTIPTRPSRMLCHS